MPIEAPTDEQRARYKAAYRAYSAACDALLAARAEWLPEKPPLPESALTGSQYLANMVIQQQLIAEVQAERGALSSSGGASAP